MPIPARSQRTELAFTCDVRYARGEAARAARVP